MVTQLDHMIAWSCDGAWSRGRSRGRRVLYVHSTYGGPGHCGAVRGAGQVAAITRLLRAVPPSIDAAVERLLRRIQAPHPRPPSPHAINRTLLTRTDSDVQWSVHAMPCDCT